MEGERRPKQGGLPPAPLPATVKRGTAMRNNRIPRPMSNVITRRAAAEPTGPVTRYRGVRPNNNNHATLAKHFQLNALHELQLGLYTNTDTPDNVH